ncbi:MAG: DUF3307 domain-containing protein [Firmicutes bacterium]|nr:DUF3307 domain-containing protein [Bacillota bacterium]
MRSVLHVCSSGRGEGLGRPELLAWLLVGHLAGDFLLQTGWMARNKAHNPLARAVHVVVYAGAVYLAGLPAGGLSWPGLALVALTHYVLDGQGFVRFWLRCLNGSDGPYWLGIVVDQAWHVVVLALVALFF